VTPGLTRAKQFYGSLLGWTFRDLAADELAYAEVMLGDRAKSLKSCHRGYRAPLGAPG
jgi:predicted enzyme related to lactoylglutathione lyase